MAKKQPSVKFVEAPPRNNVYVGMLLLTALAGLIGVALFALEANSYGWSNQAVSSPTPSLPKFTGEPADKGGKAIENP